MIAKYQYKIICVTCNMRFMSKKIKMQYLQFCATKTFKKAILSQSFLKIKPDKTRQQASLKSHQDYNRSNALLKICLQLNMDNIAEIKGKHKCTKYNGNFLHIYYMKRNVRFQIFAQQKFSSKAQNILLQQFIYE